MEPKYRMTRDDDIFAAKRTIDRMAFERESELSQVDDKRVLREDGMQERYIHGYNQREAARLQDQANTLVELLHWDTAYPQNSTVLEAGCGVGAQTIALARNSPDAKITSIDISETSIAQARETIEAAGFYNVTFQQGDIFNLNFAPQSFDHLFVCFVLEHLAEPLKALTNLKHLLKPGGTVTVIEGDHGSAIFYPDSELARSAIKCQIDLQAKNFGNALIGRALFPLLQSAGFRDVQVSPRMVYVDSSKPRLVDGFTKKTFAAMIEGIRNEVLEEQMMSERDFDQGIADLYRTAEIDGVFCYTFFKAVGIK